MEQCKEKILIRAANIRKVADVLDKLRIKTYLIIDDESIKIDGYISESAYINSELVKAGCEVSELMVQADSLEDYYFRLTGGAHNA